MAWRCILQGLGTFCTKFWREIEAKLREIYINFWRKFALKFYLKLVRIYEMVVKFKGNFMRKFLVFFIAILPFFGYGGETYSLKLPENSAKIGDTLALSQSIEFGGKTFYKRYESGDLAEYYLSGDPDFGWSELITVQKLGDIDLEKFAQILSVSLKNQGAMFDIRAHEMGGRVDKMSEISLFLPVKNDDRFKAYEANVALSKTLKCGAFSLRYAQNLGNSQDTQTIWKNWSGRAKILLEKLPKLECK